MCFRCLDDYSFVRAVAPRHSRDRGKIGISGRVRNGSLRMGAAQSKYLSFRLCRQSSLWHAHEAIVATKSDPALRVGGVLNRTPGNADIDAHEADNVVAKIVLCSRCLSPRVKSGTTQHAEYDEINERPYSSASRTAGGGQHRARIIEQPSGCADVSAPI